MLGLGVDPDDDALEAALAGQRDARRVRFEKMIGKLRDLGLPVDAALEQLPATTDEDALGRPRIARAMIAAGYVSSVEEAFNAHLSRGRPAYVPRLGLGPVDAIRAIRSAGGLASLAHFAEAPKHVGFLRELVDVGLSGLEVHYRAYDTETVATLWRIADDLRLVATGGTDYHGDRETYAQAHAQLWFPAELEGQLNAGLEAARRSVHLSAAALQTPGSTDVRADVAAASSVRAGPTGRPDVAGPIGIAILLVSSALFFVAPPAALVLPLGLVCAWLSRRWSRRQKVVATVIGAVAAVVPIILASFSRGSLGLEFLLVLLIWPIAGFIVALYLLFNRRPEVTG